MASYSWFTHKKCDFPWLCYIVIIVYQGVTIQDHPHVYPDMGPYLSHRFSPGGCCWDEMPGRSDPLFGFDIALFGLLVHAFAPRLCAKTIHTPVGREYKKNVLRAVVGFDMFVWWQFLRDEQDEILLILTQGRKQPLTSCINQTRPQISYAIFWFNQIFCTLRTRY